MAEVVLFHAALGLTPGVTALADDWRLSLDLISRHMQAATSTIQR